MHLRVYEPADDPKLEPRMEPEESLRFIRELMERSTKHSTFSGLSGVLAGCYSVAGCLVQALVIAHRPTQEQAVPFLALWSAVVFLAIGTDFWLTKRKAVSVGKTIRSRLGQQMLLACLPGLGMGALLTLYMVHAGRLSDVYPFWMLAYGAAVCAVALFSQREVARLGWAFIAAGALTLALQIITIPPSKEQVSLLMMAVAFGGFHIGYGITVARRDGW